GPQTAGQAAIKSESTTSFEARRDTRCFNISWFDTTDKQAGILGVGRSTAWALLNRDKRAGPSSIIIKRILASPKLPLAVRRKVNEYIEEKIAGLYGHRDDRRRWFRDQFRTRTSNDNEARVDVPVSISRTRRFGR